MDCLFQSDWFVVAYVCFSYRWGSSVGCGTSHEKPKDKKTEEIEIGDRFDRIGVNYNGSSNDKIGYPKPSRVMFPIITA